MQLRVGELADEELHCNADEFMVFEKIYTVVININFKKELFYGY